MNPRTARQVTWGQVLIAAILVVLIIVAEGHGWMAHASFWVLKGLGLVCFLLFAVWFARVVHASVKVAPRYALFGYSMVAVCVLSWGLAFFYPFPLRHWRDALVKDLAFYAGIPAPLVILVLLATGKLFISSMARERLHTAFIRVPEHRWKWWVAAALLSWFLFLCTVRVARDIQDLSTAPQVAVDTLVDYYHATRSGDDTLTFSALGTLRVPHGLRIKFLERHTPYAITFTPHARLLIGLRRLAASPASHGPLDKPAPTP